MGQQIERSVQNLRLEMGTLMPPIELSILRNQLISPPVLEGWDWNKIEPKLRATALRQTFVSTQLLALRDPQLNPIVKPVADGYAVFHGTDALSSFAREDDQPFLAGKNGEFVGGAVLNVADGIAMLRTGSTRFAHRNAGVHQALLAARLKCARRQGAIIAVSQSPASGPSGS
jgi:hypothetical protein